MDLADVIAAGPKIVIDVGSRDCFEARLGQLRHRGFLSDFVQGPIVASTPLGRVVISRSLSWYGRYGIRFVGRSCGPESDLKLKGRIWHSPLSTFLLVVPYVMVLLILFTGVGATVHHPSDAVPIILGALLLGGFAFLMGAVSNAFSRANSAAFIEELTEAVRGLSSSK